MKLLVVLMLVLFVNAKPNRYFTDNYNRFTEILHYLIELHPEATEDINKILFKIAIDDTDYDFKKKLAKEKGPNETIDHLETFICEHNRRNEEEDYIDHSSVLIAIIKSYQLREIDRQTTISLLNKIES